MWRLIYPFVYFRLQNEEKRRFDVLPTLVLASIITAGFSLLPNAVFFEPDGFLDKCLNLTSALTGFYIAALVAAATFSHPDLDKVIKSGPVVLITKGADGRKIQEALTRREFTCAIFGYLAFAAMLISLCAALGVGLSKVRWDELPWPTIGGVVASSYLPWGRAAVVFVYSVAISHLIVATALGLWYLMDRLYRHDREILTKKPDSRAA